MAPTRPARERGVAFPFGFRLLIPEALRALAATVLPELLDDPRLASFAEIGHDRSGLARNPPAGDVDVGVTKVLLEPESAEAREALDTLFEAEGLPHCAAEQDAIVRDMTEEHAHAER